MQVWHDFWRIAGLPSAHLLIKVIIRCSFIDTQATTRILREHLSSLPAKLEEFKGDIDQLNAFVKVTQDQLIAHGETTHDLLANLFKGYLSSKDITFRHYIEKKQEDYDDGTAFTVDGLMNQASNKFKTLVEAGKWLALSDEQAKILALETKLSKIDKKSSPSSSSSGKSPQKGKQGNKSNKSSSSTSKKTDIPPWMTKWPGKPFVDANQTKTVDGKIYWWCRKHKRFCRHPTSECRLNNKSGPTSSSSNSPRGPATTSTNTHATPTISVSATALMDE